jgi:hypothetical protein
MTMSGITGSALRLWLESEHKLVLDETLIDLEVEEALDTPACCRARFVNVGTGQAGNIVYLYCNRGLLDFGKEIRVEIVVGRTATGIFQGDISALETAYPPDSPPEFSILAEDPLFGMRLPHRTRLFYDLSIPDVFEAIASEHSLQVDMRLAASYPPYAVLAQFEQSDLSFVYDCARRAGIDIWVRQGVLEMSDDRRVGNEIQLTLGNNLISFQARADLAEQVTSLTASGWDVQAKRAISETADEGALRDELDGRRSGSQYLLESFGERREHLPASLSSNNAEAQALAEAAFRQRGRQFVSGVALAQGNPELRLGGRVDLLGLGKLFSGSYYIEKVRHLYDRQSGYRTELHVSRPGLEPARTAQKRGLPQKGTVQRRPSKAASTSKKPTGRKL